MNDNFLEVLGLRIKQLRETISYKKKNSWKEGRTAPQEYIANLSNISKNQLYLIESGYNSKTETLIKISEALDFPLWALLVPKAKINIYSKENIENTKRVLEVFEKVLQSPETISKFLNKP